MRCLERNKKKKNKEGDKKMNNKGVIRRKKNNLQIFHKWSLELVLNIDREGHNYQYEN